MKNVLLVTDGIFHPPYFGRMALHKALAQLDGFKFQHARSMEQLTGNLHDLSALVIYVYHQRISAQALAAFDDFVSKGGGVLGVHTATAAFKLEMHYYEILGGRFTGHGPVEPFEVKPAPGRELFAGIPAFTVTDELYIHELQPGITPHFIARHEGQEVPIVWTHQYGQGRICYTVPGHRTETMRNEIYQKVLQQGLKWVCRGN